MHLIRKILCLTGLVIATLPTHAAGDAERGAVLADTCLGCHGIKGYRNAYPSYRVPKLGGQQEEFIVISLKGYKNESRAHLTMQAQAATLSDQDMRDLAAYFVSLGELETGASKSNGQITRGKEKAVVCSACHGQNGLSAAPNWPSLAGQHEDYLVQVLWQYKNGERKDAVMAGQVLNLSDKDINDLAAYYAAQPGLFTASYTGE
jgi:cytochrome c553